MDVSASSSPADLTRTRSPLGQATTEHHHLTSPAPISQTYSPSWSSNAPTPTSTKPMLPRGGWARPERDALPSAGMVLGGKVGRGRLEPLSLVEGVQRDTARRMPIPRQTNTRQRNTSHPGCSLCSKYTQALEDASAAADGSAYHESPTAPSSGSTARPTPPHSADIVSPSQPFLGGTPFSRYVPHVASPSLMPESSGYGPPVSPSGSSGASASVFPAPYGSRTSDDPILHVDDDFLVYRAEGAAAACKGGRHLVVVPARHVESVYDFGPPDILVLNRILNVSRGLLRNTVTDRKGKGKATAETDVRAKDVRVGFIVSPFKDSLHPYAHLHLHALVPPLDNASFVRRNFAFGGLWTPGSVGWWELEDLIAEIREESSNNRIKSGYGEARKDAPITRAPGAGSLSGDPNVMEGSGAPTSAYPVSMRNETRELSLLIKRRDDFLREEAEDGGRPPADLETGLHAGAGYQDHATKRSDSIHLEPVSSSGEGPQDPAATVAGKFERRQSTIALLPNDRDSPIQSVLA